MDLRQQWLDGISGAKRRSTLVRWYLYFSFGAPIPILLYGWWNDQPTDTLLYGRVGTSTPFPFFQLGLSIAILAAVLYLIRKYSVIPKASANLVPLPSALAPLRAEVASLAEKMDLLQSEFTTLLDIRNFGTNPHIARIAVESRNNRIFSGPSVVLVLPVGFLKLFQQEPASAKAILAHELAHVGQKDWQLWGMISSFATAMKTLVLPLTLLFATLGLFGIGQLVLAEHQLEASSDNIRDYADTLASARQQQDQMNSYTGANLFGSGRRDLTLDPDAQIEQVQEKIVAGFIASGQALLAPLVQFLVLRLILRMRAKSEELADLAAVAYVGSRPLLRALHQTGAEPSRWNLFTAHPSLRNRIKAIKRAVGDPALSVPLSETPLIANTSPKRQQTGPGFQSLFTSSQATLSTSRLVSFCIVYWIAGIIASATMTSFSGLSDVYAEIHSVFVYSWSDLFFAALLVGLYRWKRNFWIAISVASIGQLFLSVLVNFWGSQIRFWSTFQEMWLFCILGTLAFFGALQLLLRRFSLGKSLLLAGSVCFALSAAITPWAKYEQRSLVFAFDSLFLSYAVVMLLLFLWGSTFRREPVPA